MIQLLKKSKNDSKPDDFSNISLNQLECFESIPMREPSGLRAYKTREPKNKIESIGFAGSLKNQAWK